MRRSITIALAVLAVVGVSVLATEAVAGTEKEAGSLASTGVDPDARGKVKLTVRNLTDGKLEIKGQKLDPNATFDVLVNGVLVGQFTTTGGGNGRIRFRSRPRSPSDQLLGFDPRGALVVVRNAAGQEVLAVQLADSGSVEAGDVICCIPDDEGPECENRTADECAAQGGIVVEATSCDPNPCAPVTPPANEDIQCCLPNNGGAECEDRTPAECAVEGGVNAGAGTCTPDPCQAIPPPSAHATVRVRCEVRSDRSKISVDGDNLATGTYQAMVSSGVNTATAPARQTIGDASTRRSRTLNGRARLAATSAGPFVSGTPARSHALRRAGGSEARFDGLRGWGPVIMDAVWRPIANAVMSSVFGAFLDDLDNVPDLDDPSLWRKTASQTGFVPGLLPNKFPSTNRPTFQQVLELDRQGR
jgi:hypothetical protein